MTNRPRRLRENLITGACRADRQAVDRNYSQFILATVTV